MQNQHCWTNIGINEAVHRSNIFSQARFAMSRVRSLATSFARNNVGFPSAVREPKGKTARMDNRNEELSGTHASKSGIYSAKTG